MFERLIKELRKIRPLVVLLRAVRRLGRLWREVEQDWYSQRGRERALAIRQRVIDSYLDSASIHKLQIGSGTNPLPGWLNTDYEPVSDEVIYLDATEVFPFDDQSFDYVFSEHMIEHIHYKDGLFMLREGFRVLKPGGRLRVATPDVEKIISLLSPNKTDDQIRYLEWSTHEILGLYTPSKSKLQLHRPEWDLDPEHISRAFPDPVSSACFVINNFFHSYGHRFLYNELTLKSALRDAGFIDVKRHLPGESDDEHLHDIESHQRLIGDEMNHFETMVLEARRP